VSSNDHELNASSASWNYQEYTLYASCNHPELKDACRLFASCNHPELKESCQYPCVVWRPRTRCIICVIEISRIQITWAMSSSRTQGIMAMFMWCPNTTNSMHHPRHRSITHTDYMSDVIIKNSRNHVNIHVLSKYHKLVSSTYHELDISRTQCVISSRTQCVISSRTQRVM